MPSEIVESMPEPTEVVEDTHEAEQPSLDDDGFARGTAAIEDLLEPEKDEEEVSPEPTAGVQTAVETPDDQSRAAETPAAPVEGEPPVAPSEAPSTPKTPEPETPPAAAAPQLPTTEQIIERRQQIADQISERYSLTEDEHAEILTDPKALPKMVGKLYMDIYDAVNASIMQRIPQVVADVQRLTTTVQQHENQFFTKWPDLKASPDRLAKVQEIAKVFRQMNPKATPEQFIDNVGAMAMWQLGLVQQGQPAPAPQTRPGPVSNPQRFTPSAPGASASSPTPSSQTNEFAELAMFEEKDI